MPIPSARLRSLCLPPDRHGGVAFGDVAVDTHLPPAGLMLGALHEVSATEVAGEQGALGAAFIACLLVRFLASAAPGRPVLWVAPVLDLHPPGLLAYGLDPGRLLLASAKDDSAALAAAEAALRSGALAAVVTETGLLTRLAARRLHLAARGRGATALVLRRWPHGRPAPPRGAARSTPDRNAAEGNAAATRWRLSPAPSVVHPLPTTPYALGMPRWAVELLQARGGRPGAWLMEAGSIHGDADAPNALRVVARMADSAPAPEQSAKRFPRLRAG